MVGGGEAGRGGDTSSSYSSASKPSKWVETKVEKERRREMLRTGKRCQRECLLDIFREREREITELLCLYSWFHKTNMTPLHVRRGDS